MWQEISSEVPDITSLRRLLFAASQLPKDMPKYYDIVTRFAFDRRNGANPMKTKVLLENIQFLNKKVLVSDKDLIADLYSMPGLKDHPLGVVLISPNTSCKLCKAELIVRSDRPCFLTLYTDDMGTIPGTHFQKYCKNSRRGCSYTQHYGFYTINDEEDSVMTYDDDWFQLPYFMSSSKTGFAMCFLRRYDTELLISQISYREKCDIYNIYHNYDQTRKTSSKIEASRSDQQKTETASGSIKGDEIRACLDRRRLEEAHLKYAILLVYRNYPEHFPSWKVSRDVRIKLGEVSPIYYKAFSTHYAAHCCSYPGCCKVLVIDGNQKNRRAVCAATEAGYIEYHHLPGAIKTGCQLSPLQSSQYCFHHAPRVSSCLLLTDPDKSDDSLIPLNERIIRVITGKRVTRNKTYYQVAWLGTEEVTWELSNYLPQALIDNFEAGICPHDDVATEESFGLISHTLIVKPPSDEDMPPPAKTARRGFFQDTGIFINSNDRELSCNTQKDKDIRLHHRTAGVMAGMWPCGVLVMFTELYTAESLSQVYGALHDSFTTHPSLSDSLRFICYDDGCHLRRYANNPVRRDLSPITKKLANVEIVIDKMHMAGHIDKWCFEHCNPRSFKDLDNVDTEVCEQHFSWLSKFSKMTKKMSRSSFFFFLLYVSDKHNLREEAKLKRSGYLI